MIEHYSKKHILLVGPDMVLSADLFLKTGMSCRRHVVVIVNIVLTGLHIYVYCYAADT